MEDRLARRVINLRRSGPKHQQFVEPDSISSQAPHASLELFLIEGTGIGDVDRLLILQRGHVAGRGPLAIGNVPYS